MLQYALPKQALTVFAGWVASRRNRFLTPRLIRWFVRRYGVDMAEAVEENVQAYASFNDFFIRALKPEARPLAVADWVSPVDGVVSQCGRIAYDQIFQAKGHAYSTTALLGGDALLAAPFQNGSFATLYLSPKDYHRIHMPCAGRLVRMLHVPGAFFSVNPSTVRQVPGLFARNERLVCLFETAHGPMALVMVGATIVGSMATVWHGTVQRSSSSTVSQWDYAASNPALAFAQGAEIGRFLLGSTVVLLFPGDTVQFATDWQASHPIRMAEAMAQKFSVADHVGA